MLTDVDLIEIVRDFRNSDLQVLSFADEELTISISKHRAGATAAELLSAPVAAVATAPSIASAAAEAPVDAAVVTTTTPDAAGDVIRAATIGTFWEAPAPGADPFVKLGDTVTPGQALAIVEVMKLMTEVTADRAGVIESILVANGAVVTEGQALFGIRATADGAR